MYNKAMRHLDVIGRCILFYYFVVAGSMAHLCYYCYFNYLLNRIMSQIVYLAFSKEDTSW